jgi:hypothetical protein
MVDTQVAQATSNADSDTDESTQSDTPELEFPSISNIQSEQNIFERVICAVDFLEACDIATVQEVIFVGICKCNTLLLSRIAALRTTF